METIGFGGGCHWCTEAVFQPLVGVGAVRQGFIRSHAPHDNWSEAVEVDFDPDRIGLRDLMEVHLATHASTSNHKMRGKYRSAIYAFDRVVLVQTAAMLAKIAATTGARFVTLVLPHHGFKPSDPRFHDYYRRDPGRPFCQTYIEPKLETLRSRYGALLRAES